VILTTAVPRLVILSACVCFSDRLPDRPDRPPVGGAGNGAAGLSDVGAGLAGYGGLTGEHICLSVRYLNTVF
jgi:hypothetical protein